MPDLDTAAAAYLAEQAAGGRRPDSELTVAEMRAAADVSTADQQRDLPVTTEDTLVPGPGGPVPLRIARPHAPPAGVIVYAHGGGHVTGTLDSYDRLARRLAAAVPATVVLVGYRRAPEHRCPAAADDLLTAYDWAVGHRADLAGDDATAIAIAGDSAGGNLTAVLARRLRDAGDSAPLAQVLVYPTLDAVAYRQAAYPSHRECATGYGLTHADGLSYWDAYLGPDGDPAAADASPLRVADLRGLPPAYLLTAEYDVLRDEGTAYADRLRAAGVPVEHAQADGQLHGFLGDPDRYPAADPALAAIADYLRRRWAGGQGGGETRGQG